MKAKNCLTYRENFIMAASYVIIGVHGLANKPPELTLTEYWEKSILEGLERNRRWKPAALEFDMVYWADKMHKPQIQKAANKEPYRRAEGQDSLPSYDDGWRDDVLADIGNMAAKPLEWAKRTFGVDKTADAVLNKKLPDLGKYYAKKKTRQMLRTMVREKVEKYGKDGKRVMLIAHSMGSIMAYDVLRELGREGPDFRIEHLVTIGSPLGLPHVAYKANEEFGRLRTPSIVEKWSNLADRRDPVAADVHLDNDYKANGRGVKVHDDMVINGYKGKTGKRNHHKSYGYLRTPEISQLIANFI